MTQQTAEALPQVRWRVVADGQYASRQVVQALPENVSLVIVRDPAGCEDEEFLFCSEADVEAAEIVQRYQDRCGMARPKTSFYRKIDYALVKELWQT